MRRILASIMVLNLFSVGMFARGDDSHFEIRRDVQVKTTK